MAFLYTFIAVLIVSLISFVGAFSFSLNRDVLKKLLLYMVSFAVGALLGDTFIHLLPETFEKLGASLTVSFLILSGIIIFFILEKFLRWRHCHIPTSQEHRHPVATLNFIGDGFHNAMDGIIIASSFIISPSIGLATSLAVILHEIPQEIGDFGILVHSGLSVRKALWYNFLSALTAFVGALAMLLAGSRIQHLSVYVLPITAGGFLYIAGSDLIPELHRDNIRISSSFWQLVCIVLGIAVMALLTFLK